MLAWPARRCPGEFLGEYNFTDADKKILIRICRKSICHSLPTHASGPNTQPPDLLAPLRYEPFSTATLVNAWQSRTHSHSKRDKVIILSDT